MNSDQDQLEAIKLNSGFSKISANKVIYFNVLAISKLFISIITLKEMDCIFTFMLYDSFFVFIPIRV